MQSFWTNSRIPANTLFFCGGGERMFFSDEKKILPGSDGELREQSVTYYVSTKCTDICENLTFSLYHGVWGGHKQW